MWRNPKNQNNLQEQLQDKIDEIAAKNKELEETKTKLQNKQDKIIAQRKTIHELKDKRKKNQIIRKAQMAFWIWVILSIVAIVFAYCICMDYKLVTFNNKCKGETKDTIVINNRNTEPVYIQTIKEELLESNSKELVNQLKVYFANIPYSLHPPASSNEKEAYYHSLILTWFDKYNIEVVDSEILTNNSEILTNIGRIDFVWQYYHKDKDIVIIGEVKYANDGKIDNSLKQAIKQIREKKYYEKYIKNNNQILLLGVAVAGRGETVACRIEEVEH